MNFIQQVEECLRDLAAEARKKHPGVKEASERATLKLRLLQTNYVAAVRKASSASSSSPSTTLSSPNATSKHPTTSMFQSSEVLHPFLLAANYPNADFKLLEISFKAMRLLMEADAIVPTDGIHMIRVYQIQAQVITAYYSKYYAKEIALASSIQEKQQSVINQHTSDNNYIENSESNDSDDHDESSKSSMHTTDSIQTEYNDATTGTSSSSSWFPWSTPSKKSSTSESMKANAASYITSSSITSIKNAVSSSSGQTGHQASLSSYPQMEKLALEILSSLLQLIQLLRNYPKSLTEEIWTNSVSLACLWNSLLPTHTFTSRASNSPQSNTVQQAAHSTVHQLISLMYQTSLRTANIDNKFLKATWDDLLTLTCSESQLRKEWTFKLSGVFQLCQKRTKSSGAKNRITTSNGSAALPPSPELALELMTQIWHDTNFAPVESIDTNTINRISTGHEELLLKTMGVTMALVQQITKSRNLVEKALRTVQWTAVLIKSLAHMYPNECRELLMYMINKQIPMATTGCRKHHDFEDGYIFASFEDDITHRIYSSGSNNNQTKLGESQQQNSPLRESKHHRLKSTSPQLLSFCFHIPHLWKASFVLEMTYHILDKDALNTLHDPELGLLLVINEEEMIRNISSKKATLRALTEALSDFATVGSSCRDHIMQVVQFCYARSASSYKPNLFRAAEQIIASGTSTTYFTSPSEEGQGVDHRTSKGFVTAMNQSGLGSVLGESIWIALQIIIRIGECVSHNKHTIDNPKRMLDEIFPSSLSIFQHFMKRFIACEEIIRFTLKGYATLADICLSLVGSVDDNTEDDDTNIQRKVLLASLSKLSLPSWGKNDPSALLLDHHVLGLLCLVRILHMHYDDIGPEFEVILQTFEELSTLAIASPQLSDEIYHSSLALAAVIPRFVGLSTCLSVSSLKCMTEALTKICISVLQDRDVVGDSDTVLPERQLSTTLPDLVAHNDGRDPSSIGGKIISIGVRAIYGANPNGTGSFDTDKETDIPRAERTKNVYYQDYRSDFVQRMTEANPTIRINSFGRIPFCLMLLTDIAIANLYRQKECGEIFSAQFARLASVRPIVRPFVMDIMTMQIMSQISQDQNFSQIHRGRGKIVFEDPTYSQLLAVEFDADGIQNQEMTQDEVLRPLCESIKNTDQPNIALSALGALNAVLEGTGENLHGSVWLSVIDAISSVSGGSSAEYDRASPEWSGCCMLGFKLLKLIVDDFLDQLPRTTTSRNSRTQMYLLECCSAFVESNHDINTSLTAIGLLWTIADHDSDSTSIDRALSTLVKISSDSRNEVRNAAVNTLFSCIAGRGNSFTPSFWKVCITDTILRVFEVVTDKSRSGIVPKKESTTKGSSSRYKVSTHHSRDSTGKQWVVTQVLVLRGLTRVLRNFFAQLLHSVAVHQEVADPDLWFQDAWVKILDYAFDAAGQGSGRENLDIRSIGVELLVVCCQLASKEGIQAAISPARVGTNMEVVNGALRNVREPDSLKAQPECVSSTSADSWKERLFLEAFESLECYDEDILKQKPSPDDTDFQVLHKFCSHLANLYDCCKESEFQTDNRSRSIRLIIDEEPSEFKRDLEGRFVLLINSVLNAASTDKKSRFLNQCQRCALDLLQIIAASGSAAAFSKLVHQAGAAFFVRQHEDGSQSGNKYDYTEHTSLLSFEASAVVSNEIVRDDVSDECKIFVLYSVLENFYSIFLIDSETTAVRRDLRQRRNYTNFLPIIEHGLKAVARKNDTVLALKVWDKLYGCLKEMLVPISVGKDLSKIPRVPELISIISVATQHAPSSHRIHLCSTLATGASTSFDVAKQHSIHATVDVLSDMGRKSKRHREDLLKLFGVCFDSGCQLNPEDPVLQSMGIQILSGALLDSSEESIMKVSVDAGLAIVRTLGETPNTETIMIGLFPVFCQLLTSDFVQKGLKESVHALFHKAKVDEIMDRARIRYGEAERALASSLEQISELKQTIEGIQEENEQLRNQLAQLK